MVFNRMWATVSLSLILAGGCVEKPASEPTANLFYTVTAGSRQLVDEMLVSYAERQGFRFAAGSVGNDEMSNYTVHLIRSDAQIIGVDPFVENCFRLSFYKTLRFDRASDEEIDELKRDLDARLRSIEGVVLLTEADSKSMGC